VKTVSCGTVTVVPYQAEQVVFEEDFEGALSGWSQNYSRNNQWIVGSAAGVNSGSRAAYITGDGSSYNYVYNQEQLANLYKSVTFPSSSKDFTLTFYWKGVGESSFDYMTVYLMQSSPSSSSIPSSTYRIGKNEYSNNSNWLKETITLTAGTYSGRSYYLVFNWNNDYTSYTGVPAAVDDIKIVVNN